jgi:Ca-activated chloride channel family protein
MILNPIIPIWLIIATAIAALALVVWRIISEPKAYRLSWIRRGLMIIALILICLRPMLPGGTAETGVSNLDVLFVVDTTGSMIAEDYDGDKTRLEGVRSDIKAIATNLAGARFAMITFDNDAYLAVPFTTDSTAVLTQANVARPVGTYYSNGSSIDVPIELTKKTLETAQKKTGRIRVVFYMSDGEQTTDKKPASFAELKSLTNGGAVMGYGTEQGGRMKNVNSYSNDDDSYVDYYDSNYNTKDAISKIDESNLKNIAVDLDIDYYHRDKPDDAKKITEGIQSHLDENGDNRTTSVYNDVYWIPALAFLALLSWETWVLLGQIFPKRRKA